MKFCALVLESHILQISYHTQTNRRAGSIFRKITRLCWGHFKAFELVKNRKSKFITKIVFVIHIKLSAFCVYRAWFFSLIYIFRVALNLFLPISVSFCIPDKTLENKTNSLLNWFKVYNLMIIVHEEVTAPGQPSVLILYRK